MNESLDFIVKRCKDQQSSYQDRKWKDAVCLPVTGDLYNTLFGAVANGISVQYDPKAQFEYFISFSSRHDGSLFFELEAIKILAEKIRSGNSYFAPVKPLSGQKTYIIGDLIILNEYGEEFSTEEKPWMQQRTTVCLPVKVVYYNTDFHEQIQGGEVE